MCGPHGRLRKLGSSELPLKCSAEWCCCYSNASFFWNQAQKSALISITSFSGKYCVRLLVRILRHFRLSVQCSKWHLWGRSVSLLPLRLVVQSEPRRLSHQRFCVDLMFVDLWNTHPARRALAAGFPISADGSYLWLTSRVVVSAVFKSVSLCVINFCSLL